MSLIRQTIEHTRIRYQSRCSRPSAASILLRVLSVESRGYAVSIDEQNGGRDVKWCGGWMSRMEDDCGADVKKGLSDVRVQ